MVSSGLVQIVNPGHSADQLGMNRGVLWADILDAFAGGGDRRFESFHTNTENRYSDFRFHAEEVEGMHRSWTDGQVEWVPNAELNLDSTQSEYHQLKHVMGNYYY